MKKLFVVSFFAVVMAADAADMITAREATEIAEGVVAAVRTDDAGRSLPKYLGAFAFEDTYPEDAAWYYGRIDSFGGACSARRIGSTLERNYDWFYDESATFVVTVSATDTRFASIGVASVGTRITADDLKARAWSRYWRCLPGATLDGVNSCGVAVEVNVVTTNGAPWETQGGRDINALGAVRWALDKASSAAVAASNLALRVYIPEAMKRRGYSAHFAVCDANESWVVEDGVATLRPGGVPQVLTNFRVLNPMEPYGTGYERYEMLTNEANSVTSAWFRAAYRRPFSRPTEFAAPGVGAWTETDRLLAWAEANIPAGAPETLTRNGKSWQTVHTSVYDISNRTLRVAVQETPDWYVFAVPSAGGVKPEAVREIVGPMIAESTNGIPERIAELQDGKRGKEDLRYYRFKSWTVEIVSIEGEFGENIIPPTWNGTGWVSVDPDGATYATNPDPISTDRYATELMFVCHRAEGRATVVARRGYEESSDSLALVSQIPETNQLLTAEQRTAIAKVKDKADEYGTTWIPRNVPDGVTLIGQPFFNCVYWTWKYNDGDYVNFDAPEDATEIEFNEVDHLREPFTAVLQRVLRTGDAATTQEVANAVLAEKTRATAVENGIIEQIDAFKAFDIRVMDALPASGEAGVIYLVKADDYETTKTRDECLWSQGAWRIIGSTRFDSSLIAKTKTTTPIPESMTNHVSYVRPKESGGVTMPENEDGSVVIGKGAVGTIDPDYIAQFEHDTTNVYLRSGSVAIGHNATARDSNGQRAQSIAIGWNAKASAVNAIAIGSGAVHWYETDETGPAAVASGSESVAVGYEAKARASQSMQIGRGVNDVPKSLKFCDTWVVRDGKVQGGGTDTNDVREISREETRDALEPSAVRELSEEVTVKSHAMTAYAPTNGTPEELLVSATASRNFEIFLPNTPEMRAGLPFSFTTEIEGEVTKLGPWWTDRVLRLPAKLTMGEPLRNTLILEAEEYATDWDWTPVVTRAFETNGWVRVEGTNLHFAAAALIGGVKHKVANPLYRVVNVPTNGVSGATGELVGADGVAIAGFSVE